MKRFILLLGVALALVLRPCLVAAADAAPAAAPAVAPAAEPAKLTPPSLEERIADLEAYVNNGARGNVANPKIDTKVGGPGPGHNGFQMICGACAEKKAMV